ncbi:MAG: FecR domain-containing protein [Odoribacteraceae bacterium]|jgi:ferric-dicitrate binding protein FerR (iron transport regulator)|nr:FecR domain-containing protein [Odoribacteraceae bacterium]
MKTDKALFRLAGALAALFTGSRTDEDEKIVSEWTATRPRRQALVGRIMDKERFEANRQLLADFPGEEGWERASKRLTAGNKRRRLVPRRTAAAVAAALLVAGMTTLYLARDGQQPGQPEDAPAFTSGTTGALLTLGSGRVVSIDKRTFLEMTERDGTTIVVDSGAADYRHAAAEPAEVVYNTVRTPTGMEFPVTLADGTRVYLNAESSLTFPTAFAADAREVTLEGEAFFKVSPDASRPFTVRSAGVEVRVLGTSFNLRAYENERSVAATLVEGKVALAGGGGEWQIAPGEQASYVKATGECRVRPVDVNLYTAWQSGKFVFKNERLEDILSYLSRWYGFKYAFVDQASRDVVIGASLNRYADMEPIIRILRESNLVNVMVDSGNAITVYSKQ